MILLDQKDSPRQQEINLILDPGNIIFQGLSLMEIILFLPKKIPNVEPFLMIIEELFLLETFNHQDQDLTVFLQNLVIMKAQEQVHKVYMKRNEKNPNPLKK